ncbi:hypothetical protein [Brachyspira hyodysenteriae]|uniref:hypothetical protein n=1 Tax=Brachyspira hyodysenteriae TaxID=159 RepID=UPI0022CE3518|nr:hypothetical protein [Brachyspira hyodysenteriae]MCZ9888946.1 hypothetical protein [Brachyspira hyodysenteriae]
MIKTIKEKNKKYFQASKLFDMSCLREKAEGSFRVLSLNVDGTVGAYAVHRECELKIKEANPELKLKKVRALY